MLEILETINNALNFVMLILFAVYMVYFGISKLLEKHSEKPFIALCIILVLFFAFKFVVECLNNNVTIGIMDAICIFIIATCLKPNKVGEKAEKTEKPVNKEDNIE